MSPALARALQPALPTGPIGVAARRRPLPDNYEANWRAVNAVQFTSRGSGRRSVWREVARRALVTDALECFAALENMAAEIGMSVNAYRRHMQALESAGMIEVIGGRSGGRRPTRYRIALPLNPPVTGGLNPPVTGPEEVLNHDRRAATGEGRPSGRRPSTGRRAALAPKIDLEVRPGTRATPPAAGPAPPPEGADRPEAPALGKTTPTTTTTTTTTETGLVNGVSALTDEQETQARQRIVEQALALGVAPEKNQVPTEHLIPVGVVWGICTGCSMVQVVDGTLCSQCEDADKPRPKHEPAGPEYTGRPSADWNQGGDP